ncbi:MAG: carbohydrate ABC transporter permease, partial [Alicyclobacillus sp.]|nr:carbohydrate ABC transporter permease [Alicyclobacillus sp.]
MKTSLVGRVVFALAVLLVVVLFAFPFVWMVIDSLKTQVEITSGRLFPFTPTWVNYHNVFAQYNFLQFIINSLLVAVGCTIGSLLLGLPAAYAIARYRMEGLGVLILVARIIPGITFLIPWFILFTQLHLVDTFAA